MKPILVSTVSLALLIAPLQSVRAEWTVGDLLNDEWSGVERDSYLEGLRDGILWGGSGWGNDSTGKPFCLMDSDAKKITVPEFERMLVEQAEGMGAIGTAPLTIMALFSLIRLFPCPHR